MTAVVGSREYKTYDMRGRITRTAKAQGLMKIEPPATVDTAIAQQCQIDDGEHDLEDSDIEEVGWREGVPRFESHVVVGVGIRSCRFEISIRVPCVLCWISWESPFP